MATLNDTKKIILDEKTYLQSQNNKDIQTQNLPSSQLLLPPPPTLKFQRQQQKKYETKREDSIELKTETNRSLNNAKESIGNLAENTLINSQSNIQISIIYYRQTTESIREISLDNLKLQKDYFDAFQPMWLEHINSGIENFLIFQDKMFELYTQMCNLYLKNKEGSIKTTK